MLTKVEGDKASPTLCYSKCDFSLAVDEMSTKRQLTSQTLAEDDGMLVLRRQVQAIISSQSSHEGRAEALRRLMIARQRDKLKAKAITPPKPQLEALPVELIESIVRYLPKWCFGVFRLASKTLKEKSSHAFTKRFFETRTIKLEWESLRQLAIVFTQPHLLHSLRRLIIMVEGEGRFLANAPPGNPMPYEQRSRAYPTWRPDNCTIARSFLYMLDRALSRLSQPVAIEFHSLDPKNIMSSHAIALLLAAISSSGCKVSALHIGGGGCIERGFFFDHEDLMYAMLGQDFVPLRRSFETLNTLELSWTPRKAKWDGTFGLCETTDHLLKMVPNLHTLIVWEVPEGIKKFDGYYLDCCQTRMASLKVLKVFDPPSKDGTDIYGQCLVKFAQRCAPALEQLCVYRAPIEPVIFGRSFRQKLEEKLKSVSVVVYEQIKDGPLAGEAFLPTD